MSKIRTITDLQDCLDHDFSWRLKEVADLKDSARKTSSASRRTIIRAGIALLYAHWEGFIKTTSQAYLEYVSRKGLQLSELKSCFVVLGLKRHLSDLETNKKTIAGVQSLEFIQERLGRRDRMNLSAAIDTESNLSSAVFDNIANSIAIDTSRYEAYYHLLDESLLARRNSVAHGEYLDIDATEWRKLADQVLFLMRQFKTDIENNATTEGFRRTPP